MENVYVKMTLDPTTTSWYGVFGQFRKYNGSDISKTKNCVFNVTMTKEGNNAGGVAGAWNSSEGTLDHLYLINNSNTQFLANTSQGAQIDLSTLATVNGYEGVNAFFDDNASFSSTDGWSSDWKVEDGKLYFGENVVMEKITKAQVALTGEYDLDLTNTAETLKVASLDGEVQEIKINGATVSATYADGVFAATISGLTAGNAYPVTITTSTTIYSLSAKAWTRVISTNAEYKALIASNYDGANNKQYCFDADIDATGIDSRSYVSGTAVKVVLDGKGHVISNFTGWIFHRMGDSCVIRNIAFVDCTTTNWFVARKTGGLLENVYIDVEITTPGNGSDMTQGGVVPYGENAGTLRGMNNCVINAHITPAEGTSVSVVGGYNGGFNFSNVYIINQNAENVNSITYGSGWSGTATNVTDFTSESEFLGDNSVAFNSADGWASYWQIKDGELWFGSTKVIAK